MNRAIRQLAIVILASAASAQDVYKLPVAEALHYTTTFEPSLPAIATAQQGFSIRDGCGTLVRCGVQGILQPGWVIRLDKVGSKFTDGSDPEIGQAIQPMKFGLVTPPQNGITWFARIHFDDGTNRVDINTPPIGFVFKTRTAEIQRVKNDGTFTTCVVVWTAVPVDLTLQVFDDFRHELAREAHSFSPIAANMPIAQYCIKTPVTIGSMTVYAGGLTGAPPDPIYGLVSISRPDGTNADVQPFIPSAP